MEQLNEEESFDPVVATPARVKDEYVTFYKTSEDMKYRRILSAMPAQGSESLVVEFDDLMIFNSSLGLLYRVHPEQHTRLLREAALEVLCIENPSYAREINSKKEKFFLQVENPYEDSIPIRLEPLDLTADSKLPRHSDLAASLCEVFSFRSVAENGDLYVYLGGIYRKDIASAIVSRNVQHAYPDCSRNFVLEVLAQLQRTRPVLSSFFDSQSGRINLRNGLFDVKAGALIPHSPDYLLRVQLPWVYDPAAACPHFHRFLVEAQPDEEDREMLRYQMAYCFIPEPFLQKAFMHIGSGANGKSTWLYVLNMLLGRKNVSSVSIHALSNHRFAAAELDGKLANIFPDIGDRDLTQTGTLKALIAGDPIQVEYKGKPLFTLQPRAKLFFSANKLPVVNDDSDAWFRRWIIQYWNQKFEGDNADENLREKLTTPEELSGIFNWILPAIKDILDDPKKFPRSATADQVRKEWGERADLLQAWVNERLKVDVNSRIPKPDLHTDYVGWCVSKNYQAMGRNRFYESLRTLLSIQEEDGRILGKHTILWKGIAWKNGPVDQKLMIP